MNRLTFEGNFCDIAMCQETPGGSFCEDGYCSQRKVWERLKQYEDTWMEPEDVSDLDLKVKTLETIEHMYDWIGNPAHLREMVQAEQDGRLLVLPCKIGDTLYMIVKKPIPEKGWSRYVRRFSLTYKNLAWVLRCLGKRVFPSSEEAEAAISVMERKAGAE